ncbi:cation:proton antiporter [Actinomycetospora soli]|uniref:cation:proton antiporter n=1 Tax=Actinomycetospora soli TaxID=2893887 RepID=UPI001E522974|nr:cation:proton antiporter [Actinomycetospora soli]MCD2186565.1 cation:proton antiporter [Actinomycetospora soli]
MLVVLVSGFLVIAVAAVLGPRLGIAAPLLLVVVGVGASFLPLFAAVEIEPEWILEGVLPPLLYSSAVSMPAMNFRREFAAISGLSVVLVVGSSLVLGLFFALVVPGLGFAWGVALGAIVSPTDAVATSIVRRTPTSARVVAMLEGESLLNDATALVILRTAIVATAAAFSFWGALGTFAYSVAVAVVVGALVGRLALLARRRITDPTVSTVISFAVPFLASVPAELLEASGLVAAVVAGLVTGVRAPRDLSSRNRLSDSQNWRTVELVLEGAVFLTMGLQIRSIVESVERDHAGVGTAVLIAVGALVLTVLVRAAYVAPLLRALAARARQHVSLQGRLTRMQDRMGTPEGKAELAARSRRRLSENQLERFALRITRGLATIRYFLREPLGWREGAVVVWAGMRGAVTVAAAQTLPETAPQRSVLVLVAFTVATLSLLVQGGTTGPLVRRLARPVDPAVVQAREADRAELVALLRRTAEAVPAPHVPDDGSAPAAVAHRLAVLAAQRDALLTARDDGTVDADVLQEALANLDASEIAIELRGRLAE